nr:hypothetical protein [Tanacetum cinerariifolium]
MRLSRIANMDLLFYEVGLRWERDVFVCGCRSSSVLLQRLRTSMERHKYMPRKLVDIVKSRVGYSGSGVGKRGASFNTIITSLKALDELYSSKNCVRKFLKDLHSKLRAKVTAIKESKDLTSLLLDELTGNLKVYEMIIKKDPEIDKDKGERKSLALKVKKNPTMKSVRLSEVKTKNTPWRLETSISSSREEEDSRGDPNHLIGECSKLPKDKNQRAFVEGSWSDSGEEDDEKAKDKMCLVAQASNEVRIVLKIPKISQKTGQYQHKIGSQQQKPDQRAIFSKKSSNEAQKSKIQSSRDLSCQLIKVQIKKNPSQKFQGPNLSISQSMVRRTISA